MFKNPLKNEFTHSIPSHSFREFKATLAFNLLRGRTWGCNHRAKGWQPDSQVNILTDD